MNEAKRQFQFRVNGIVMPYIRIQYEKIEGAFVGRRQIAVAVSYTHLTLPTNREV